MNIFKADSRSTAQKKHKLLWKLKFIAVFTRTLNWTNPDLDQFTPYPHTQFPLRFVLIVFSHLRLGIPNNTKRNLREVIILQVHKVENRVGRGCRVLSVVEHSSGSPLLRTRSQCSYH
jgi:hypothetical protein